MVRIRAIKPLKAFEVELTLTDGSTRRIDLLPYLRGPVFDVIRDDPDVFRQVTVDDELGTIVWPNGADIDPDVLIHGRRPAAWSVAIARDGNGEPGAGEP